MAMRSIALYFACAFSLSACAPELKLDATGISLDKLNQNYSATVTVRPDGSTYWSAYAYFYTAESRTTAIALPPGASLSVNGRSLSGISAQTSGTGSPPASLEFILSLDGQTLTNRIDISFVPPSVPSIFSKSNPPEVSFVGLGAETTVDAYLSQVRGVEPRIRVKVTSDNGSQRSGSDFSSIPSGAAFLQTYTTRSLALQAPSAAGGRTYLAIVYEYEVTVTD